MQFHASKIVSALILLNTTICLAMQKNGGYNPFKIEIASATCKNRVYSKAQISMALFNGLQSISTMSELKMRLDAVQYIPQPRELMPSKDKFFITELQRLGPYGPTDLVIFSSTGLFVKVATRVLDSQGFRYINCVYSRSTTFPQQLQPNVGFSGQNSGGHDPFGIGITFVSCEGRVYNKLQISMAIGKGMKRMARMIQSQTDPDLMQYKPKPTEVMPSQDKFYYSHLKRLKPDEPVDLVIFSSSGQFAKVVSLKEDGGELYHIDCVSSSNGQSPERSPSMMGSLELTQLKMGSSKRRRLRSKSPEQESSE